MNRASDKQLELDFEVEHLPIERTDQPHSLQVSASIVCFTSHLRSRLAREKEADEVKLVERITNRVQHFK